MTPRRTRRNAAQAQQAQAREVLKKFRVVFSSIKTHFRRIEEQCGISGSQVWMLSEIGKSDGIRVSDLARSLLVHQSTASNLLDKLDEQGLVEKRRSAEDQRVVRLYLTSRGRQVLARSPTDSIGIMLEALQRLSPRTLEGLGANMDELLAVMDHKDFFASSRTLADL